MNNISQMGMSNVYLISDFKESYDSFFDSKETSDIEFKRVSTDLPSKHEMFRTLKKLGIKTTPFGKAKYIEEIVSDFYKQFDEKIDSTDKLVVYINDKRGMLEEKVIMPFYDAIKSYPNELCSLFIPCKLPENNINNITKIFHREFHIGKKMFWLRYSSKSSFKNNKGDVSIEIVKQMDVTPKLSSPLYYIDYIFAPNNDFYAIDFNISPVINGTGIESILSPKEISDLIKEQLSEQIIIKK